MSSNHDSAFAFASIAAGLWCKHADVGELILANFHLRCPYLVPYYIPLNANETREQYFKFVFSINAILNVDSSQCMNVCVYICRRVGRRKTIPV